MNKFNTNKINTNKFNTNKINILLPKTINIGRWSANEQKLYLKYFPKYPKQYKYLSKKIITTRTPIQIRSHHQKEEKNIKLVAKKLLKLKYMKW